MRTRWPLAGLLVGACLVAGSVAWGATHRAHPVRRGTVPAPAAAATRSATTVPAVEPGIEPSTLVVPALSVRAAVVPVVVGTGGALGVPDDPQQVGWWAGGALPGSTAGTTVLDGHVDSATSGDGALFRLRDLDPGSEVDVAGAAGEVRYRVAAVEEYDKGALPAGLFTTTGAPRLVVVTCGGPFDRATRHYRDNLVAYAAPVGP